MSGNLFCTSRNIFSPKTLWRSEKGVGTGGKSGYRYGCRSLLF